jgi:diguanylate cyclase (GGDEF)-like protein
MPNQAVFVDAVERAVADARERGVRAGVVMTGLDEFKLVNNTMGHHTGDEVLRMVGRRLTEATDEHERVRNVDGAHYTVARLGSDEFATCLGGVRDQDEIDSVVTAVMECFAEPFVLDKGSVALRASIGVAMTGGETGAAELLRQADLALSVAKDAGRNRVVQYEDSLHALVSDRLQMRGELERAVAEGSFVLEFQPIVGLPWSRSTAADARRTVGFEALVRWQHPERGTLGPGEFIALAEESGLIVPLGNWVLHHSIRAAVKWHALDTGRERPYVSVNVSARQLRTTDFVGRVLDELTASGLPPSQLVLEITETMLVQEGNINDELARLRGHGVRVAIDDFGTGFSSLSYLRQLPADVLKLDKSFAETITTSTEQRAIVGTVTELAHTLHMHVVAEGIESEQELAALSASGCGFGQGYAVSRPMPHNKVVEWLRDEAAVPVPDR